MTQPSKVFWWIVLGIFGLDIIAVQFLWMPPVVPQTLTAILIAGLVWGIAKSKKRYEDGG